MYTIQGRNGASMCTSYNARIRGVYKFIIYAMDGGLEFKKYKAGIEASIGTSYNVGIEVS
jgi:hypothetical protein